MKIVKCWQGDEKERTAEWIALRCRLQDAAEYPCCVSRSLSRKKNVSRSALISLVVYKLQENSIKPTFAASEANIVPVIVGTLSTR
uniref:Uncharacterized protein n=1 Tax=Vespula pensylvanica TaxID=30213 RepID=A0A834UEM5_VESPE|nr:hypothetical protein H0235_002928 [Vespula pensylvanica]